MKKIIFALAALTLVSCDFNKILKDENGKDIPLINVDFPTFDATYNVHFTDLNGNIIDNSALTMTLTENNPVAERPSFITLDGKILNSRVVSAGVYSFSLNPNIKLGNVSGGIGGHITGKSSAYVVMPQFFESVKGANDIVVKCVKVIATNNTKAISYANEIAGADFITAVNSPSGNGFTYQNLYRAPRGGTFIAPDAPAGYTGGLIALIGTDATPKKTITVAAGGYFASTITPITVAKKSINVKISGLRTPAQFSGSINDELVFISTDASGNAVIANYYYNPQSPQITLAVRSNDIYTITPSSTVIDLSQSAPSATFTAAQKNSTDKLYTLSIAVVCSSTPEVALSPTMDFQYKLASSDKWISASLVKGKTQILMTPNQDYSFRIMFDGKYHSYTITNNPSKIGEILGKYKDITSLVISETTISAVLTNNEACDYI